MQHNLGCHNLFLNTFHLLLNLIIQNQQFSKHNVHAFYLGEYFLVLNRDGLLGANGNTQLRLVIIEIIHGILLLQVYLCERLNQKVRHLLLFLELRK